MSYTFKEKSMVHKLIESVTTTGAIATAIVFVVGYGLVQLFAWKARKEAKREKLWDESDCYK